MDRNRLLSRSRIEPGKIIVIFFGICTGFVLWLAFDFPNEDVESLVKSDSDWNVEEEDIQTYYNFQTSKKILFFTPRYGQKDWNFGQGNKPFENAVCRQQNCYLTSNQSLLQDVSQFDAILFHMSAIHNQDFFNTLPEKRSKNQKYVFSVAAPPKNGKFSFQENMKGFFNWTMTYHSKSTIHTPSARIVNLDATRVPLETKISVGYSPNKWSKRPDAKFFSWNRTNLVAWLVDDCNEDRTHREDYVSYLENYIQVDIYGKCGNLECPSTKGETCLQFLGRKYKFMLAFESDLCNEFASFKWFSIMDQPTTVAVVMGAADYTRLAPPKSYINVADFKSAKELANYLLFLNANDGRISFIFRIAKSL